MALAIVVIAVVVLLLAFYALKTLIQQSVIMYYLQKASGPPKYNILCGNMYSLMDTPDKIFQVVRKWGLVYYPFYKLWIGPIAAANMMSPEDIGLVLGNIKHSKKSIIYKNLNRWLGTGLLTSHAGKWSQRRKILTPAFHFSIIQDFILTFNERTEELVQNLKKECDKPYTEITEIITNVTLKIIAETAMGKKLEFTNQKEADYENALHELGKILVHKTFRTYLIFDWIYIFAAPVMFLQELKLTKTLHEFTKEIIREREKNVCSDSSSTTKSKRLAMLDLLLATKKETELIDYSGIREEVDTFMFEGHDTISAAISFGLMLIACHDKVQEAIVREMRDVLGDIKKKPDYNDLQNLKYMDNCIKESLRFYPSVPYMSRTLGEDLFTHSGYKLKKNTLVQLHVYDLHHNPDIYPDPEKFDPDRFLSENSKHRHPYAYIPFSAGPRNCIGQRFAMLEIKTIFCGILGNFVLQPVDTPETIVPVVDLVLRTKEHIKVKFLRRDK